MSKVFDMGKNLLPFERWFAERNEEPKDEFQDPGTFTVRDGVSWPAKIVLVVECRNRSFVAAPESFLHIRPHFLHALLGFTNPAIDELVAWQPTYTDINWWGQTMPPETEEQKRDKIVDTLMNGQAIGDVITTGVYLVQGFPMT